jgi:hypothetical protein
MVRARSKLRVLQAWADANLDKDSLIAARREPLAVEAAFPSLPRERFPDGCVCGGGAGGELPASRPGPVALPVREDLRVAGRWLPHGRPGAAPCPGRCPRPPVEGGTGRARRPGPGGPRLLMRNPRAAPDGGPGNQLAGGHGNGACRLPSPVAGLPRRRPRARAARRHRAVASDPLTSGASRCSSAPARSSAGHRCHDGGRGHHGIRGRSILPPWMPCSPGMAVSRPVRPRSSGGSPPGSEGAGVAPEARNTRASFHFGTDRSMRRSMCRMSQGLAMSRLVLGAGQRREGSLPPAVQGCQKPVIDRGPSLHPWRGSGWAALPGSGSPTPLARRRAALQVQHARSSQRGSPNPARDAIC